jgi:hypothetical protein
MLKSPVKAAFVAATAGLFLVAPFSIEWSGDTGVKISLESAQARIGRPLTPLSGAGVVRRTTRRHLYGAPVVVAPACVRVWVNGVYVCR